MNEYMIRFVDGTIKHIKADRCVFANIPSSDVGNKPCAIFYRNNLTHYVLTLDSISAIRFPEVKDDTDDSSRTNSEV